MKKNKIDKASIRGGKKTKKFTIQIKPSSPRPKKGPPPPKPPPKKKDN